MPSAVSLSSLLLPNELQRFRKRFTHSEKCHYISVFVFFNPFYFSVIIFIFFSKMYVLESKDLLHILVVVRLFAVIVLLLT